MSSQSKELKRMWNDADAKVLDLKDKKYAIFSDLHLGDRSGADDFKRNEKAFLKALDFYFENGFSLIFLGDTEELWQFDLETVKKAYENTVYKKIRSFGKDRVFRVYGNHDLDFSSSNDTMVNAPGLRNGVPEFLKMKAKDGSVKILLFHGHQGTTDSDKFSWISKFGVRGLWKPIELLLPELNNLFDSSSATKSMIMKDYDWNLYKWAKKNHVLLVCGHSHRAIFGAQTYADKLEQEIDVLQLDIQKARHGISSDSEEIINQKIHDLEEKLKELLEEKKRGRGAISLGNGKPAVPCYFNSGSAVFTNGVTNIEITESQIALKKWNRNTNAQTDPIDYGSADLVEILNRI